MKLRCLWCLESEPKVTFIRKAHTIPKSLGGQNYNKNVCDLCNSYFGNKQNVNYSIEEALKETFNITRRMLLKSGVKHKRKVGEFKSRFFDIKERKGKSRLSIKPSFRFNAKFQRELCYYFKRGLYKMYLEELNRQTGQGFEPKFDVVRKFARYGLGDPSVLYFTRVVGVFITMKREAETPVLFFDRMKYLYSDNNFVEIEFLGHVFGFPVTDHSKMDFDDYLSNSFKEKESFFREAVVIDKLTDIDLSMSVMNN